MKFLSETLVAWCKWKESQDEVFQSSDLRESISWRYSLVPDLWSPSTNQETSTIYGTVSQSHSPRSVVAGVSRVLETLSIGKRWSLAWRHGICSTGFGVPLSRASPGLPNMGLDSTNLPPLASKLTSYHVYSFTEQVQVIGRRRVVSRIGIVSHKSPLSTIR